jgi:predicted RNA-binding Zn-ribbon protein involved in translation (DUF1610 family)
MRREADGTFEIYIQVSSPEKMPGMPYDQARRNGCPTCIHTMDRSGAAFWCPQCGTLVDPDGETTRTPALVHKCRMLEEFLGSVATDWVRLGIHSCIRLP